MERPSTSTQTWRTKDGRVTTFAEMTNTHLENLIVYFDKRILKLQELTAEMVEDSPEDFGFEEEGAGFWTLQVIGASARGRKWQKIAEDELKWRAANGVVL